MMAKNPCMPIAIDALGFLADSARQERVWVYGEEEFQFTSPSEAINVLFDDGAVSWYLENGEEYFDAGIDNELKKLDKLLDEMDFKRETMEMFRSKDWGRIVEAARKIWGMVKPRLDEFGGEW